MHDDGVAATAEPAVNEISTPGGRRKKSKAVGEASPAAPAVDPATTYAVEYIDIDRIIPTPDNPRTLRDDERFAELVTSIRNNGVLVPLIARPMPGATDRPAPRLFDLRAGHRRLAAARRAGLATVPVHVRDMDDKTAMELTITENLQREDLTPFEESAGVQRLLEVGWTIEAIADRLGKSPNWVALRAKLSHLTPGWRASILDEKSLRSHWHVGLLERIAALPSVVQDEALELCARRWEFRETIPTVADLRRFIDGELLRNLAAAPFKLDDATLVPEAGACTECPKRASCEPLLFGDLEDDSTAKKRAKGDRCLDMGCYAKKAQAAAKAKLTELRMEDPKVVAIAPHCYPSDRERKVLEKKFGTVQTVNEYSGELAPAKAGDKGAIKAVIVHDDRPHMIGTTTWVKPRRLMTSGASGGSSTRKPKSLDQRKEELAKRRWAWVVGAVQEVLEDWKELKPKGKLPSAADLPTVSMSLAIAYGAAPAIEVGWLKGNTSDWAVYQKHAKANAAETARKLFQHVVYDILESFRLRDFDRKEMAEFTSLTGINLEEYERKAEEKFPEPKSWAKEEAAAKAKTPKASKKAKAEKKRAGGGPNSKPVEEWVCRGCQATMLDTNEWFGQDLCAECAEAAATAARKKGAKPATKPAKSKKGGRR